MEPTAPKEKATGEKRPATALELGTYVLSRSFSHASHEDQSRSSVPHRSYVPAWIYSWTASPLQHWLALIVDVYARIDGNVIRIYFKWIKVSVYSFPCSAESYSIPSCFCYLWNRFRACTVASGDRSIKFTILYRTQSSTTNTCSYICGDDMIRLVPTSQGWEQV